MAIEGERKHVKLMTWKELNAALRECDERTALEMLAEEQAVKGRREYLRRIYQRANKLRRKREAQELLSNEG